MNRSAPLDAFYEAVFLTDAQFRIVGCNARAIEIFRMPSQEALLGRDIGELSPEGLMRLSEGFRKRLESETFIVVECRAVRGDGTEFIVEAAIRHISEETCLFTLRDVTTRVEALHRLEAANERLRAQDRDRLKFVSNVSHELRTPLTSMSYAITNMLRGLCGELPEKAMTYLEHLQVDAKRLMTTVNDILDLRQIENHTITMRKTLEPLTHLLSEVAAALIIQAETKKQTLIVRPSPREIYSEVDRHKLERVFFNILSNAVKYTPEGGKIHGSVKEENGRAWIVVEDNGIGIPPEALPRVSQRYFRVGDQVTGTGLGLSIVREIIELHHGQLRIESPVPGSDCGTRVTIELAIATGPLLVIVSGDEEFIAHVQNDAQALGNSVRIDREALHLVAACHGVPPARFIFDGSLPESYLGDLIVQIREDPKVALTPILVLTPEDIDLARKAESARMHVEVQKYPLPLEAFRALLQA
ncbi:MAG: ATP-binding protein [Kiritimatiellia bacterium]